VEIRSRDIVRDVIRIVVESAESKSKNKWTYLIKNND